MNYQRFVFLLCHLVSRSSSILPSDPSIVVPACSSECTSWLCLGTRNQMSWRCRVVSRWNRFVRWPDTEKNDISPMSRTTCRCSTPHIIRNTYSFYHQFPHQPSWDGSWSSSVLQWYWKCDLKRRCRNVRYQMQYRRSPSGDYISSCSTSILMKKKTKIAIPEQGFDSFVFLRILGCS